MPHYALVIDDPKKHHAAATARQTQFEQSRQRPTEKERNARDRIRADRAMRTRVQEIVGAPREAGDLHGAADSDCPDGFPNCRNCGDPAFTASCVAAGHCEYCGTRHGIAPARALEESGLSLVAIDQAQLGHQWDRTARAFMPPVERGHESARRSALAKLTPEERAALGIE